MRVQRDFAAMYNFAYPGFCSNQTSIAKHWFLIFIFIENRAFVTGGRNSNATFAQSPVISGHSPFFERSKIISPANEETENVKNQCIYRNIEY